MAIVSSIDDWKKKKENILTPKGTIKEKVAQQEDRGFELCILISEELSGSQLSSNIQSDVLTPLWVELKNIISELSKEHAYFYFNAFQSFWQGDEVSVAKNIDLFIESKKRLFNELPDCDWWIDNFIWVFNPPYLGFYSSCAESFHKHFPSCAMGWVCGALEQSESINENVDIELDLLSLAIADDKKFYLAYYLVATLFADLHYYSSALHYYKMAQESTIYSQDPSFYFEYARCAEKAGETKSVIELYSSCLSLDEYYPGAINNLGCIYLKVGDYNNALSYFYKAINLDLDGSLPYRNIVVALEKATRYDECLEFIEKNHDKLGYHYLQALPLLAEKFELSKNQQKLNLDNSTSYLDNFLDLPPSSDTFFAKRMLEDELENLIKSNTPVFGRNLQILEDEGGYGRQYFVPEAGRIDLLCKNKDMQELCIISVNNNIADEHALFDLARQIDGTRDHVAKRYQKITGIIFCKTATDKLKEMTASINTNSNIEIFEYNFEFTKIN